MINNYITTITNNNFDEIVLNNTKPVLLDFWAEWCNPCKIFIPILETIAKEYRDNLIVSKLNIDEYSSISSKYSIQSIPTLLFFNNKNVIARHTGVLAKSEIRKLLKLHFKI